MGSWDERTLQQAQDAFSLVDICRVPSPPVAVALMQNEWRRWREPGTQDLGDRQDEMMGSQVCGKRTAPPPSARRDRQPPPRWI